MNARLLEQFLALAEHLHFGRAAEATHASTSALSRGLRQLEEELGVRLFERDNRRVALTGAGRRFRRYARESLGAWTAIRHELSGGGALTGEVSLYCSVTASHGLLSSLLERLRAEHPGIELALHTGDPEDALPRVVAGREQIAIAARPGRLPRGALFARLTVSPLVFVAPREGGTIGLDGRVPPVAPARASDWSTVPMILAERGVARRRVDAWFRALGTTPRVRARVAGNEAIVAMVALGLGVGVVPRIVLDNSPLAARVRVLDVAPALTPYEVGLVTLARHLNDPLVAAFWALAESDGDGVPDTDR